MTFTPQKLATSNLEELLEGPIETVKHFNIFFKDADARDDRNPQIKINQTEQEL